MVSEQEDSSSIDNTVVAPSLQGVGSSSMDPSNPFYLHPSNSPEMSLVSLSSTRNLLKIYGMILRTGLISPMRSSYITCKRN